MGIPLVRGPTGSNFSNRLRPCSERDEKQLVSLTNNKYVKHFLVTSEITFLKLSFSGHLVASIRTMSLNRDEHESSGFDQIKDW